MAPSPGRFSWREIADLQSGVISEHDAMAAGLTRADIRARVADGTWRQPARGVLVTATATPPLAQQAWAALLAGGPNAVLGGSTAAALDGLVGHGDEVVTVLVPPGRRGTPVAGVVFRRTARLAPADVHRARLPPRTAPARSVVDMAEWCSGRDGARAVISDALLQGFVTIEAMRRALARRGPISRRTLIADTLDELNRRTPRMLSLRYKQLEAAFGLPPCRALATPSPDVPTGRLDVWYGPWRLLVRVGQPGPRRPRPAGRRILTVRVEQLWQAPAETAALVAAALREQVPTEAADRPAVPPGPDEPATEWHETVRDEHGEADQGGGGGQSPAVASSQMRELPPWEAERAAGQLPVPPTA
ncbi:conserved hypothetical protein [Frankia sp. Hr75.2]|nr:conserved hypothetical protein [Frankia sp. Hr75.2]SQD94846.1 conserved hypothetical protein [Parafrankia sp. Ea1.12]